MFVFRNVRSHSLPAVPAPLKNSEILQRIARRQIVRRPSLISSAKGQHADDKEERKQNILRRVAALKEEQEALAAEFAAAVADGDDEQQEEILQILKEEGLDDIFKDQNPLSQLYNPTAGEIPEGILRFELERLLGLRPADDLDDPLAQGLDFEAVEEFSKLIEQGNGSLQPPASFWDAEPEPGDQFLDCLNKSVENFEEMLLSKKEQAKLRRERKAAGEIDDPEDSEDAFRSLLNDIPMFPEDYIKNIPAPDIPEKAVTQFERAERVLLVLRRALLEDGFVPSAGVDALVTQDLVSSSSSEKFFFEDPWMAVDNFEDALQYLKKMELYAGIHLDVDTMFSSYYEYKPEVKCRIVVHTLMHVPLPACTDRRQAGEAIKINLLKNGDDEIKPLTPGVLFPRELKEGEKPNQRAFARWLRKPVPVAAQRQVLVPNPTWKRSNEKCDFEVIGNNEHFPPQTSKKFPNYSLLTPAAALLTNQGSVGWYAPQTLENSSRQLPPLPRPEQIQPEDLDFDPLTPDEAEQLLRELLGNKFDDIAAQLPTKAQGAFVSAEQFNELQIGVTWSYEIDPRSGKVSSIFMQWNWVGGPIADITHAYDIYLAECGLV
ncbi:hypothetical protein Ndes2526A_g03564 [Nannochloris sp. 'desiccata']